MVPHLTTALTGPLLELERQVIEAQGDIEHWLRRQWLAHPAPFYSSVDLRNAGFKLAPVDTNLFPGGFNNLNPDFLPLAVQAAQVAVEKMCADARSFLIIPENHTRNLYYLQNVVALVDIIRKTGLTVRIGSLIPGLAEPLILDLPDGGQLTLEPVRREGNRLKQDPGSVSGTPFDPCSILLNNDLSSGAPAILEGLDPAQTMLPPLHAGWASRSKSKHFSAYDEVAHGFAGLIGIDPWSINPYHAFCGEVDFQARVGEECLADHVAALLGRIRAKYAEYGIGREPFVIVKADAGTYGMGIMTVKSPDDVRDLNRKQRNKMAVVKEGLSVSHVLVQEGVPTYESLNEAVAEPVVYMIDHFVIGGFYRNRFYTYGVLARLAALAAAIELEQTAPEAVAP